MLHDPQERMESCLRNRAGALWTSLPTQGQVGETITAQSARYMGVEDRASFDDGVNVMLVTLQTNRTFGVETHS